MIDVRPQRESASAIYYEEYPKNVMLFFKSYFAVLFCRGPSWLQLYPMTNSALRLPPLQMGVYPYGHRRATKSLDKGDSASDGVKTLPEAKSALWFACAGKSLGEGCCHLPFFDFLSHKN